ncbi:MAG: hypothetical protein IT460_02260 [Planctomycetes bacterium]|nr:hypothetical protein [Planctomycetota bacterium]
MTPRAPLRAVAAALALAGAACGGDDPVASAWRAGRHAQAAAALDERVASSGAAVPPALLADLALARWRAGDLEAADRAAERAAATGDDVVAGRGAWVRGLVASARSDAAERAAGEKGGDVRLREQALADAEDALARFRSAAVRLRDREDVARNVERALLRVERLRRRVSDRDAPPPPPRGAHGAGDTPPAAPGDPSTPPPPTPPDPATPAPPTDPTRVTSELSPDALARLSEVLAAQERRKAQERRARRLAPPATAGDDR